MKENTESRKAKRPKAYSCRLNGHLDVMFPEKSFAAENFAVVVEEMSVHQVMMRTWEVSLEWRDAILSERRVAELEIDLGDGRVLKLRGRIIWLGVRNEQTRMQLEVLPLTDDQLVQVETLFAELAMAGRIADLSDTAKARKSPVEIDQQGYFPKAAAACPCDIEELTVTHSTA